MKTFYDRHNAPRAPNPTVHNTDGEPVELAGYWREGEFTSFVFTRHFG